MRQQPGQGDASERFTELFAAHHGPIWSYARRRVNSQAEADDLASEVFATAWRRFDDLPPANEQRLWLFGVARNVVANHRRSLGRQRRLTDRLREGRPAEVIDIAERFSAERDDPLWNALARLPDETRDLLIMRAWDGIAVQDIAVLLDCTPNAVSLRLRSARNALRSELDAAEKDCRRAGDEGLETTSTSTATRGES